MLRINNIIYLPTFQYVRSFLSYAINSRLQVARRNDRNDGRIDNGEVIGAIHPQLVIDTPASIFWHHGTRAGRVSQGWCQ